MIVRFSCALLVGFAGAVALPGAAPTAPLTPEAILAKVVHPPAFSATVFASPPELSYPVYVTAALDGMLFVSADQNGSLGREPNRGKIVRMRDTDGDGRADEFKTFATMDSPRGVAWDQSTRTLYVMHPPDLTAYHDDDGDGVSERKTTLVKDLGFGLAFRGADHTTNGIRLGIDGWIYVAVGDYGAVKAVGRDERSLALRGGGIVRVRPDGTGLELVAFGARNILAVAVSPSLDLFTRDNTNDGDDWNVRLTHNPLGALLGYPSLFRSFADEVIPPLADFGGGSPVGAIFLDESSLPAEWAHGFYSVEWGRNEIAFHPLTPAGATWKAGSISFVKMPRATDMDIDGSGRLYVTSWDGGGYNYGGPNVGYLVRLAAKAGAAVGVPDFANLAPDVLVSHVGSGSAVWRLAAQRELLKRGAMPDVILGLRGIADRSPILGARVAAIFTIRLLLGGRAIPELLPYARVGGMREFALKALADDPHFAIHVPAEPFVTALEDADPRVRLQAVTGLGRLGRIDLAPALLRRTADSDYTVAHIAVQSLRALRAADACLAALDGRNERLHRGALQVLQALYEPLVVRELLDRLRTAEGRRRVGIFTALARLNAMEAPFTEPKMWWGTRPDTSGPVFKPERWEQSNTIEQALKAHLQTAQGDEAKQLVHALLRMKVTFDGFTELMLEKAGDNTAARLDLIAPLVSPKAPMPEHVGEVLLVIIQNPREEVALRARALRLVTSAVERNVNMVADAIAPFASGGPEALTNVWEEFTRDVRLAKRVNVYAGLAKDPSPGRRAVGTTVLVNLVGSPMVTDPKAKESAKLALAPLWNQPEQATSLLETIARTQAAELRDDVQARIQDPDPRVAAAARHALVQLGGPSGGVGSSELINDKQIERVSRAMLALKGDPIRGKELFLQRACFACHTVSPAEPPKGPMLGGIGQRYSRSELVEAILAPNAKIAQGFESQGFTLRNNSTVEGFVVREGGDSIDVRSLAGIATVVARDDIVTREKREMSTMPSGLMTGASVDDLAALLAYLEAAPAN